MDQRSDEWFAARAGKLTGSRFGDLMAVTKSGPSASRVNLIARLAVERITGRCVETYANSAMQRGVELEEQARAAYESHAGVMVEEMAFIEHPELPFVGVSPDGLVGDDGMVEVKCPSAEGKHVGAILRGEHAREYHWQIQGQLWVAGRAWCDAVSFDPRFPDGLQLAVTRVQRDDSAIAKLRDECIKADAEIAALVEELNTRKAA
jgi:putative phage-type endonuclease